MNSATFVDTEPHVQDAAMDDDLSTGLGQKEAEVRLTQFGPNVLPEPQASSLFATFLRQFRSPLIYILLAATLVSLALGDVRDALFIGIVLVANGTIGCMQEHSAGKAADRKSVV